MKKRIYVVGAGGKTTLIDCLAHWFQEKRQQVLILTTTHRMLPEEDAVLFGEISPEKKVPSVISVSDSEEALRILEEKMWAARKCGEGVMLEFGQIVRDRAGNLRVGCPEETVFHAACEMATIVLVEADGSHRLPIKVPAEHEPVIFDDADLIFVVQGLSAVGKKREDVCHRRNLAEKLLTEARLGEKIWKETSLTEVSPTKEAKKDSPMEKEKRELPELVRLEEIGILIKRGYLEPLRTRFPRAEVVPVLNQADDEEMVRRGQQMLESLGERNGIVGSLRDGGRMLSAWNDTFGILHCKAEDRNGTIKGSK